LLIWYSWIWIRCRALSSSLYTSAPNLKIENKLDVHPYIVFRLIELCRTVLLYPSITFVLKNVIAKTFGILQAVKGEVIFMMLQCQSRHYNSFKNIPEKNPGGKVIDKSILNGCLFSKTMQLISKHITTVRLA